MGSHSGNNSNQQQQQEQQQFQTQQSQQQALYQTQLQQEQSSFSNFQNLFTAQQNQNLSAQVKPNGGFYGAQSIPQGTYLSSQGSRNTFLGG